MRASCSLICLRTCSPQPCRSSPFRALPPSRSSPPMRAIECTRSLPSLPHLFFLFVKTTTKKHKNERSHHRLVCVLFFLQMLSPIELSFFPKEVTQLVLSYLTQAKRSSRHWRVGGHGTVPLFAKDSS